MQTSVVARALALARRRPARASIRTFRLSGRTGHSRAVVPLLRFIPRQEQSSRISTPLKPVGRVKHGISGHIYSDLQSISQSGHLRPSNDPVRFGPSSVRCRCRLRLMMVQRLHYSDMREHQIAAVVTDQHQARDRSLPMLQFALGFGQFENVSRGVAERDQLAVSSLVFSVDEIRLYVACVLSGIVMPYFRRRSALSLDRDVCRRLYMLVNSLRGLRQ